MKSLHTGQVIHLIQVGTGHQQTSPAVGTALCDQQHDLNHIHEVPSLHTGQVVHLIQVGTGHQQTPPAVGIAPCDQQLDPNDIHEVPIHRA